MVALKLVYLTGCGVRSCGTRNNAQLLISKKSPLKALKSTLKYYVTYSLTLL